MSRRTRNQAPRTASLVLRSASLRVISMLVNLVGTFFLMPFMVWHLGDYWYGMWALIGAVVVQYHILDFGLSQTIVRFVSRFRAENTPERTQEIFSTALAAFSGFGALTFVCIAIAALNLDIWVEDPAQADILAGTVLLVGASLCCAFPTYALEGCFSGAMRQDIPSVLQIFRTLLRLSLTWYFIGQGYSIMALAAISFGSDSLYRLLLVLCIRRTLPEAVFRKHSISWQCMREMMGFGRFVFLTNISRYSIIHSSMLVTGICVGVPAATTYAIALNIIDRLEGIVRMALFMTMPAFSGIAAAGIGPRLLQNRFMMVARIAALGVTLVCGGLMVAGAPFITAWMGPDYLPAYWPLLILSIAWMADLSQVPALQVLTAMGQHRRFAYYDLGVAASSLSLAIMLGPVFGLAGVAGGVALPVLCSALLLKPRFVARALGLSTAYYYGQMARMMLGGLVLQVPVWLVLQTLPPMPLGHLALFGIASYTPVAFLAGTLLLPKSDQAYVLGLLPVRLAGGIKRLLPHLRQPA